MHDYQQNNNLDYFDQYNDDYTDYSFCTGITHYHPSHLDGIMGCVLAHQQQQPCTCR